MEDAIVISVDEFDISKLKFSHPEITYDGKRLILRSNDIKVRCVKLQRIQNDRGRPLGWDATFRIDDSMKEVLTSIEKKFRQKFFTKCHPLANGNYFTTRILDYHSKMPECYDPIWYIHDVHTSLKESKIRCFNIKDNLDI